MEKEKEILKRMNDINTFQCCDGNFLNWIDTDTVSYIKEQVIKHIKNK